MLFILMLSANSDGFYLHKVKIAVFFLAKCYLHYVKIAIDSIYTVKIAVLSAIYTTIANSGKYLHLSIVVHCKTVFNNNLWSVNDPFY